MIVSNGNIIFVGGVHGVGKTVLCRKILNEIKINHYSASKLISKLDKNSFNNVSKTVLDIDGNQDKLMIAMNIYMDKIKPCLLDGHFCLLNSERKITKIPERIFENISPAGIVIVCDSVANISDKIFLRDKIRYDVDLLSIFQEQELNYSQIISRKLDVRYKIFNVNDNFQNIINFIKNLIKGCDVV